MFRRGICTEPGSEQVGSVLVLGAEVVQVRPIQMFGPKQNYSSKRLDRTSTGPGSEQMRRLNSLLDFKGLSSLIHRTPLTIVTTSVCDDIMSKMYIDVNHKLLMPVRTS